MTSAFFIQEAKVLQLEAKSQNRKDRGYINYLFVTVREEIYYEVSISISGSDPALHVLQHGEPEPQLGAGHPGDGQLPPDRLTHQGLRHLCQREVGVITLQCTLYSCTLFSHFNNLIVVNQIWKT
jgi:hypothetical protein